MSHPKLSYFEVQQHPAVVTRPDDLRVGSEVVLGHFREPIGRAMRLGQAALGYALKKPGLSRAQSARQAYNFTPAWGIIPTGIGTVNWVVTDALEPYATFTLTHDARSADDIDLVQRAALTVEQAAVNAQSLPQINATDSFGEHHTARSTFGFDALGFAPDWFGMPGVVIDLSKL